MDSLESLNLALQRLTDASVEHLSDLERIVALGDATIDPLGTEGPLSEEQSRRLDHIRRWMTSPWYFVEPERVSILTASDDFLVVQSFRLTSASFVESDSFTASGFCSRGNRTAGSALRDDTSPLAIPSISS